MPPMPKHRSSPLLDRRRFVLDADRYHAFLHALDNPPASGPKLRALMRRVPAWRNVPRPDFRPHPPDRGFPHPSLVERRLKVAQQDYEAHYGKPKR
jgi:hypothetical protein